MANQAAARVPPKAADPFYTKAEWKELRRAALERDGGRCVVCGELATRVDHIVSRRRGGPDRLENLRSLCATHDNRVKEDALGERRSRGQVG